LIRVGIGGWTYEPWRGSFFPAGWPKAKELEYCSRQLTAIEVNGTFYRTQTPASFRRWAAETPDDFVFTLKGPRYVVNRRVLAEAGESIAVFLQSGITELGGKLGPILWQLAPTKQFDEADLSAFLELLPPQLDGQPLRHALEVRHQSFLDPRYVALARRHHVATVYADSEVHPAIADATGPFVYARLQRCVETEPCGYASAALDVWAGRARTWASGADPADLPRIEPAASGAAGERDVFIYFISGYKARAPAAAQALLRALNG
jgi:uncharacterized protein YecE (DUF72 family)